MGASTGVRTGCAIGGVWLLTLSLGSCTPMRAPRPSEGTSVKLGSFSITWDTPFTSGSETGVKPAIASCGDNRLVEVRQAGVGVGPLLYRLGNEFGGGIIWGSSGTDQPGVNPAVACSGTSVVRVYQSVDGPGPLWFEWSAIDPAGLLQPVTVTGSKGIFANGMNPAIAHGSDTFLTVYQVGSDPAQVWYRIGSPTVVSGTSSGSLQVVWGDPQPLALGLNPAIAVTPDHRVIVVFQATAGVGPLRYRFGALNGTAIEWGSPFATTYEDSGVNPAIAAVSNATVTEVHQTGVGVGPLWYRIGRLSDVTDAILWDAALKYADSGLAPSITLTRYKNPGTVGLISIAVHQTGVSVGPLEYRMGFRP
jgi:hypothetical protein